MRFFKTLFFTVFMTGFAFAFLNFTGNFSGNFTGKFFDGTTGFTGYFSGNLTNSSDNSSNSSVVYSLNLVGDFEGNFSGNFTNDSTDFLSDFSGSFYGLVVPPLNYSNNSSGNSTNDTNSSQDSSGIFDGIFEGVFHDLNYSNFSGNFTGNFSNLTGNYSIRFSGDLYGNFSGNLSNNSIFKAVFDGSFAGVTNLDSSKGTCIPTLDLHNTVLKDIIKFDILFSPASENLLWKGSFGSVGTGNGQFRLPSISTISPDGKFAYVTDYNNNRIVILDRNSLDGSLTFNSNFVMSPNFLLKPVSISFSPDGKFAYVSTYFGIVILNVNFDGSLVYNFILFYFSSNTYPNIDSVVVSLDGNFVYAAANDFEQILIFSRSVVDGSLTFKSAVNLLISPDQLALSPDGKFLYVGNTFGSALKVLAINFDGSLTQKFSYDSTPVRGFEGLVISPDGLHLYASNSPNSNLVIFSRSVVDGSLSYQSTLGGVGNGVWLFRGLQGLTVSPDGKFLYVADTGNNRIVIIDFLELVRIRSEGFVNAFRLTKLDGSNVFGREFYVSKDEGLSTPSSVDLLPSGFYVKGNNFGSVGLDSYSSSTETSAFSVNDHLEKFSFKSTGSLSFNQPSISTVWDTNGIEKAAIAQLNSPNSLTYVYGDEKTRCFSVTPPSVDVGCTPELNGSNVIVDAIRFDVLDLPNSFNLNSWVLQPLNPMYSPLGRYSHTSFVLNNMLFTVGGMTVQGLSNVIDFTSDGYSWTRLMPNPPFAARQGHSSFVINVNGVPKACIVGGATANGLSNEVWCTLNGMNWVLATNNPGFTPRLGQTTVVFNGIVYLIGGYDVTGSYVNDVWASNNGVNWIQQPLPPFSARYEHVSFVFGGKLYVAGGEVYEWDSNLQQWVVKLANDVWSTPDGINWIQEPDADFTPRKAASSFVWTNKAYVIAGDTNGIPHNSRELWSFDGNNWKLVSAAPGFVERHGASASVFNGKPFLIFGDTSAGMGFSNDMWVPGPDYVVRVESLGFPNDAFKLVQPAGGFQLITYSGTFYINSDGTAGLTPTLRDLVDPSGVYTKVNGFSGVNMGFIVNPLTYSFSISDGLFKYFFEGANDFGTFSKPYEDSVWDVNNVIRKFLHQSFSNNLLKYTYGDAKTRCFKISPQRQ